MTIEPAVDLADFLEGEEPSWEEEPAAPPDPTRANALLARLRRIRRERKADEQLVRDGVDQLGRWLIERERPRARQELWLATALQQYHRAAFARSGTKSIALPNGRLTSRMGQPSWQYDDEAAFLAWAEEHAPAIIRRPPPPAPEIDKNAAKQLLTRRDEKGKPLEWGVSPDGEKPPGLQVIPGERSFSVEIPDDEERVSAEEEDHEA